MITYQLLLSAALALNPVTPTISNQQLTRQCVDQYQRAIKSDEVRDMEAAASCMESVVAVYNIQGVAQTYVRQVQTFAATALSEACMARQMETLGDIVAGTQTVPNYELERIITSARILGMASGFEHTTAQLGEKYPIIKNVLEFRDAQRRARSVTLQVMDEVFSASCGL